MLRIMLRITYIVSSSCMYNTFCLQYVLWPLSPGCRGLSQVDERHIPSFRIMHQGKEDVGEGAQEDHHYPFAGKENPKVCVYCMCQMQQPCSRRNLVALVGHIFV